MNIIIPTSDNASLAIFGGKNGTLPTEHYFTYSMGYSVHSEAGMSKMDLSQDLHIHCILAVL